MSCLTYLEKVHACIIRENNTAKESIDKSLAALDTHNGNGKFYDDVLEYGPFGLYVRETHLPKL